jgi:hypothetical protein
MTEATENPGGLGCVAKCTYDALNNLLSAFAQVIGGEVNAQIEGAAAG